MQRVGQTPVDERERWLSQLSGTLSDAQQVLFELDLAFPRPCDVGELFQRIEAARMEVRSLQLNRSHATSSEKHPVWTSSSPWQTETQEGC